MKLKCLKTRCFFLVLLMLIPLLTGCELANTAVQEGQTKVDIVKEDIPAPVIGAVCNPFGGGSAGREQGLEGELFYLPPNLPQYAAVESYIDNGTKLDATLFFDQVNVPTRAFDRGFTTLQGETLKTPSGDTLYEWFAIRFQTVLKLVQGDRPGRMQLALLSDDGSVLREKHSGQWATLVNNDGTHPTRLKVAEYPLEMDASSEIALELQYFQGPRHHIAAVLMWREWPEGQGAWIDPLNGASGNGLFFDSTQNPSAPQPAYQALLSRGWRPIPAKNFFLARGAPANPCPEIPPIEEELPDPNATLVITGFDAATTTNTAELIWRTSGVPSTTVVRWGLAPDQLNQEMRISDPLVMVHQIQIGGLTPQTRYYFKASSTDAQGLIAESQILQKTTK